MPVARFPDGTHPAAPDEMQDLISVPVGDRRGVVLSPAGCGRLCSSGRGGRAGLGLRDPDYRRSILPILRIARHTYRLGNPWRRSSPWRPVSIARFLTCRSLRNFAAGLALRISREY